MKVSSSRASRTAPLASALLVASLTLVPLARSAKAAAARGKGATVRLTAVDAGAMRRKLAALRGKIVVLNMWATWCGPCVMEFPELVRFERAYRGRGVVVIGLSTDDPGQAPVVVPPFLKKQKVTFPVYTMKPPDPRTVIQVFDKYWEGSIPMTYVFDRTGQLQTRLAGAQTIDQFEMAVKPLLK